MHSQKIALVTGGTGGIGEQIVRDLIEQGLFVLFTGRNRERGLAKEAEGHGKSKFIEADLSSQAGVVQLAAQVCAITDGLDVLINNVGGVFEHFAISPEGVERTLAINLVHPYLLAGLVMGPLSKRAGRIIQLSTGYHHLVRLTKSDLEMKRFDCGMNVYGRSKLISVRAGQSFGALWSRQGVGLHFADPGMAQTPLTLSMTKNMFPWYGRFLVPSIRSVQKRTSLQWCASSSVFLATRPELPKTFGVYVLPGPRMLAEPLIGYSKKQSKALKDFTLSLMTGPNRLAVSSTLGGD